MFYYFHVFRRLRKIHPSVLLPNIYVQSKIDYGLSIWGCTTEVNLNRVQRIQNLLARIMSNNFDAIHSRGIDFSSIIEVPNHTRKTRLLSVCFNAQVFMASHPIIWVMTSPCMLIYIGMIQRALRIWIYIYMPRCTKDIYKIFFV